MLQEILGAFHATALPDATESVSVFGDEKMPSCFQTTELASCSIAAAGLALRQYATTTGNNKLGEIAVNRRLASLWFHTSLKPVGWQLPPPWDAIAGNYPTSDGWIRLHTNAPHHKAAAVSVLKCAVDREAVAAAVAQWPAQALESAIVRAHGCAAQMRSIKAWHEHPQGRAVRGEPLVIWEQIGSTTSATSASNKQRPLAGIKVLDLTRVLAGPVATRFLAAFGADVLRIDSPAFDDSSNAPDMSLGKRCALLDLRSEPDRSALGKLISEADVLVHGYRSDALASLGFDAATRITLNPDLIDVALCAYGWSGPWAHRRGFDSLVQMSSGLAQAGMGWRDGDKPYPLPVQALDHATGYLAAGAVLHALAMKAATGQILSARLSLAKTADLLSRYADTVPSSTFDAMSESDLESEQSETAWGLVRRLQFPAKITGCTPGWEIPAGNFCSSEANWRQ